MPQGHRRPLNHLSPEDTLIAGYAWIHRLETKNCWSFLSRVNLILCAANLLQSRTLLKVAGVG
ncbi:hypothetical protein [Calidithermus chliarophilus]|uniref:hypothetical protein n=1 Tax=Calidithermus chliarophilus TaxID=52023 RepID=UPI000426130B|nr:hypothetical protein [Calidithermus chliarophilus]